ncbi:MAG TPA: MarR family transcriptional regulator [Cellvibrio sp.]|nr:MarR family transcriptional regulator [Cellvibrio sp.]
MNNVDEVLTSLRRVIRAIDLHSQHLVKTASVTGPQLRLLQLMSADGQPTVSDLAKKMSLSQATVTSIMDRLANRGLIERVRSTDDKRKVHPKLTEEGREILAKTPTPLQDSFVRNFNSLKSWEQNMIIASIQRIAEMMGAEGVDAAPFLDIGSLDRKEDGGL